TPRANRWGGAGDASHGCMPRPPTGWGTSPLPTPLRWALLIHLAMLGHLVVVGQGVNDLDGEIALDPGRDRSLAEILLPVFAGTTRPRRQAQVRHVTSPLQAPA